MDILGIRVENLTLNHARDMARNFLGSGSQYKIFTPNPEMIVKAQSDDAFRKVLNSGDLNLCDGFGLHLASGAPRITGVDFALELCKIAAELNQGVFLLGGIPGAAEKATGELVKQIPGLKVAGWDEGPHIVENHKSQITNHKEIPNPKPQKLQVTSYKLQIDPIENNILISKINQSQANMLFVAFGMGKQEKWIAEYLPKMPNIKIAMGVGGALDYFSGLVPRAPLFFRRFGLEWIYRLIVQPRRFFRILNATVVFMYFVIIKFLNPKSQISNLK